MRLSFVIGALVVVALVIGIMQFWPGTTEPEVDPATSSLQGSVETEKVLMPSPAQQTALDDGTRSIEEVVSAPVTAPAIELPAIYESDNFVRQQVAAWALPEVWLQREDLIARASVVLLNAANGKVPRRQLAFLAPAEAYPVTKHADQVFLDPQGYKRYDPLVDVLMSVPADDLARVLVMVEPLLLQALAQLGETRSPADLASDLAQRINALPRLPAQVALEQTHVMYQYVDAELERLPEFEKQILRMGPDNILRLQRYISDFNGYYSP